MRRRVLFQANGGGHGGGGLDHRLGGLPLLRQRAGRSNHSVRAIEVEALRGTAINSACCGAPWCEEDGDLKHSPIRLKGPH